MFELFQPTHLIFVLLVALVVLGPKRLAGMSREIGQTIQRFQEYTGELKEDLSISSPTEVEPEEKHPLSVSTSDKKG